MRKFITMALASLACVGGVAAVAAPAALANSTQDQVAWTRSTNNCLRFTGCHNLYLAYATINSNYISSYSFEYYTTYYGKRCYSISVRYDGWVSQAYDWDC